MGARRHKRRSLCTEVRIFGSDAHGHPFSRLAETVDVSVSGARLSGVFLDLRAGDEIELQSESGRARYQVVWQGQLGTAHAGEVAVHVVDPSSALWPDDAPGWTDTFDTHALAEERRSYRRFPCNFPTDVIAAGDAPRLAKCVDLSFGGCYLETASPLPEGARVSLCIRMTQGPPLDATGFVRTSHVHFGMGVRFTSVEHPEILAAALKGFVPSERWSEHPSMVATVSDISLPVPDTNRADKTVLVVDDSLTIRNMVAHHLRRSGYSVAMAKDGEEALSIVQSQRPSLILLDMLMPRMSGLAVLRKLKTNSSTRDIPVVVISSLGDNNNARLLAEGACGFMSKAQISPDKMPQIIDRYLRNPGAARVYEAEVS